MNKLIRVVLMSAALGCSFAFVVGEAVAGAYDDGVAAYVQGDYATALKVWLSLAQAGDATAQNGVGMIYEGALGVAQDKVRSYMWFRLAAAQGEPNGAKNEKIVAANLTPAQLAQAKAMATKCKASGYKDCGE